MNGMLCSVVNCPIFAQMSNSAMISTGNGMNTVASTTRNTLSRPGHSIRLNP